MSRVLSLSFVFLLLLFLCFESTTYAQDGNGICCDVNSPDYVGGITCQTDSGTNDPDGSDNVVCDLDCDDYTDGSGCTTIPLDGGLSLLALAGGGLATAAMRRRREEEEAAQGAA
jgi:hypothetical protein